MSVPAAWRNDVGWFRFLGQVQKDARLWLFCMAALSLFRLVLFLLFRRQQENTTSA